MDNETKAQTSDAEKQVTVDGQTVTTEKLQELKKDGSVRLVEDRPGQFTTLKRMQD